MNILIFISSLSYGGAEKQAIQDANMLCELNKVFLITFDRGPLECILDKKVSIIDIEREGYLWTSVKLASVIRHNNISIIHAHLFAPMIISAIAGIITNIPVIWNFHSHAFDDPIIAKKIHKYSSRLPSVKMILFPAAELDNYYKLEGYRFSRSKCKVVFNSGHMDLRSFEKEQLNFNKMVHIGFVGRVVPLKRLDILIELTEFLIEKGLNNFTIDIVGDGPELENLIKSTHNKRLGPNIKFFGFQQDTYPFYRQFDIFALPSEEEVLSLSLIDAGLSAVPSVAFMIGGNSEIIIDGFTGFLVNSKEMFFEKIMELVRNKHLRDKLGLNSYKECFRKFSSEVRLKNLTNLYGQFV